RPPVQYDHAPAYAKRADPLCHSARVVTDQAQQRPLASYTEVSAHVTRFIDGHRPRTLVAQRRYTPPDVWFQAGPREQLPRLRERLDAGPALSQSRPTQYENR